ncbi:MAG: PqqD family protein [Candidatus Omnitrophica bacterium]|nr:PqqD family protein [Candidatus Omnitrophota bacterium]MBU1809144.1 PqqD family protein [Candidatus Omnitrophota bacterium]
MDKVYSKNPDVVFRKIADECILVPIKNRVGDMECIYTLSEVAARIWELIDGRKSSSEINRDILNEYDVSPENAERDLRELFMQLEDAGSIRETKDGPS